MTVKTSKQEIEERVDDLAVSIRSGTDKFLTVQIFTEEDAAKVKAYLHDQLGRAFDYVMFQRARKDDSRGFSLDDPVTLPPPLPSAVLGKGLPVGRFLGAAPTAANELGGRLVGRGKPARKDPKDNDVDFIGDEDDADDGFIEE